MPYATDYTTLLSGSYWSGAEVTAQPVILTYSFLASKPKTDPHFLGSALNTFVAFTAPQQSQTQQALARWSDVSGVVFKQVAAGQGDVNFAAYDLTSVAGDAGGQGYFPWGNWNYSTATSATIRFGADIQANGYGDVQMNTAVEDGSGLFAYPTLLHEIGHALGLKHPTEPWTSYVVAHNQWDPGVVYDGNFSIMSPGGSGSTLTDITSSDIQAIQSLYGTSAQQAAQFSSLSWNTATTTLTATLKNGGQSVRGVSASNTITGGTGDDTIYAIGQGTNRIFGKAGADTLVGGSGVNYLDGGAGADTLNGWFSPNTFASYADAAGAITVNLASPWLNAGDAANDVYLNIHRVLGSNFADAIAGDNSGDILQGGAGDDTLTGGAGVDYLYGQAGADTLMAGAGTSYLDGGAGADTLIGSAGHASFAAYSDATAGVTASLADASANTGDAAGDAYQNLHRIVGSKYADILTGDNSGDILQAGAGDDTLVGGAGLDHLYGQAGDDTLTAGAGTSYLDGGAGADKLIGALGHATYAAYSDATAGVTVNLANPGANAGDAAGDSFTNIHDVLGSNFADEISGDTSADVLNGGAGADTISGGTRGDILIGGAGADSLTGGLGADQFRFNSATEGGDTITDFSSAQGDKIGAWSIGFGAGLVAGVLDPAHFALDAANAANSQFIWVAASHALYWDSDGTGSTAAVLLATLQGVSSLSASDIKVF